ncbi:SagB family peptide dehydrogenase [Dictyobacter kobayashii]|uniref:Dehydrogenase n=1 Tax=Dictyobacter kobayashii TaxID=2014872 RepID=A0A402ATJ7_9CHLR|nr:SagB family peptide dehydrogenase [Dictyobacter kobayashii]GCE22395.1 dehydrogenase [Dictyobacter kobayashii]
MGLITTSTHIFYCLTEGTEMREEGDNLVVHSPFFQITISRLSPGLHDVLRRLEHTPCSMQWINEAIYAAHEESQLTTFYRYISSLLRHQMVHICVGRTADTMPLASLYPMSISFQHQWINIKVEQVYRMSRFAYLHRGEDGLQYLESPLAHACIQLHAPLVATLVYQLGTAMTPPELARALGEEELDLVASIVALLLMGNFAAATRDDGRLGEDSNEALRQWEFHDLLFHSRSRVGRHNNMVGGTYRFLHQIQPQPVVKQSQWPVTLQLPQPDMARICSVDPPFATVMEERCSIRTYDKQPITLDQLSEFLYRVARVKATYIYGEGSELSKRPYPGGGASYEIEFYLTIDHCAGLPPGLYWYDPLKHALALIRETDQDTERLLIDACQSMGDCDQLQVLITLAARFQRVSWKYQSIAYALILKDVGVLYDTMYLVATAMQLAPCALGAGDADLFSKLIGSDYFQETSVGEFTLGSKATLES